MTPIQDTQTYYKLREMIKIEIKYDTDAGQGGNLNVQENKIWTL